MYTIFTIAENVKDLAGSAHAAGRSSAQRNMLPYPCVPNDALLWCPENRRFYLWDSLNERSWSYILNKGEGKSVLITATICMALFSKLIQPFNSWEVNIVWFGNHLCPWQEFTLFKPHWKQKRSICYLSYSSVYEGEHEPPQSNIDLNSVF